MRIEYKEIMRIEGREEIRSIQLSDGEEAAMAELLLRIMDKGAERIQDVISYEVDGKVEAQDWSKTEEQVPEELPTPAAKPASPMRVPWVEPIESEDPRLVEALLTDSARYNKNDDVTLRTSISCPACKESYSTYILYWNHFLKCSNCRCHVKIDQATDDRYVADKNGYHFYATKASYRYE